MSTTWKVGDRILNRWEIHKILRGGMGVVYVVYDHEWHEALAAKTFPDEAFACNPAVTERFRREALAWVGLDYHPNITRACFAEAGSHGTAFVPWDFVLSNEEPAAKGTCRGYLFYSMRFARRSNRNCASFASI